MILEQLLYNQHDAEAKLLYSTLLLPLGLSAGEDSLLTAHMFQRPPPPPHIACQEFLMDFETDTE